MTQSKLDFALFKFLAASERNQMKPSIETAKNIANTLGVIIDYLIGDSDTMAIDKSLLQRMEDI